MELDGHLGMMGANAKPIFVRVQRQRRPGAARGTDRQGFAKDGPELPGQGAGNLDHGDFFPFSLGAESDFGAFSGESLPDADVSSGMASLSGLSPFRCSIAGSTMTRGH